MDSYAIARAESRIDQLEREVRQLKLNVERNRSEERSRRILRETGLFFWFGMAALLAFPIVMALVKHQAG